MNVGVGNLGAGLLNEKRVAIVHEWLVDYSGSERVLEQIVNLFPHADLFSVVEYLPEKLRGFVRNKPVGTTFIQHLPFARTSFRNYLPLMPLAIEQLDLSAYDVIISSSHAVAKGVLTGPDQLHVSYVHSPMRYAWDMQHQYLREAGLDRGVKGWLAKWVLHRMRLWDSRTANGVDAFVANSRFIARRIAKTYRRDATVIYPPVDVGSFTLPERGDEGREDFYLAASRLVPYKRMDLIVEAFSQMPGRKLVVIGDGPCMGQVRAKASSNVTLMGYQPFAVLREHMQNARAFVFAAEEDFGIIPVEAQACGTPVIAFGRGGAAETIRGLGGEAPTGVLFGRQDVGAIVEAVELFGRRHDEFRALNCRNQALKFGIERFRDEFGAFVLSEWTKFHGLYDPPRPQSGTGE